MSKKIDDAEAAKTDGMDRVAKHANAAWMILMLEIVERVCRAKPELCADDVFDIYEEMDDAPRTHDLRAFGPVMKRAAKKGFCVRTDRVTKSHRVSVHRHPLAIWKSSIFEGDVGLQKAKAA